MLQVILFHVPGPLLNQTHSSEMAVGSSCTMTK